jgi:signal transduction histidine kinase
MSDESSQPRGDEEGFLHSAVKPCLVPPRETASPLFLVEQCLRRTAAEEAHCRLTFLARAAADLGNSLDADATARSAVRMTVPALAELTILVQPAVTGGDWTIVRAVEAGDAVVVDEFMGANRLPSHVRAAIDRALVHDGQEYLHASVLCPVHGDPELIAIPLRGRGQTFGVLTFSHERSGRQFSSADQQTVEAFASYTASAMDKARHQREVEEADRRKNEALSVLAHELRNPLAVIRHAVAVLRLCNKDESAVRSTQDVIDRQVTHMVRLVDDLSDLSRLANGKVRLELEPLDLTTVVREAVENCRAAVELRKHRLAVRWPQAPLQVLADRVRLTQVVTNLLSNASKYTPPGGCISLSVDQDVNEAVLSVCDNGIGIPAVTLPKVFDTFLQAEGSLGMSQGGLGIGLSLVRRFVEMHGGSVQAASAGANCGSEFTVRLPLARGSFDQPLCGDRP